MSSVCLLSCLPPPDSNKNHLGKNAYYNTFTQIAGNCEVSGLTDITPLLLYFIEKVYNQMGTTRNQEQSISKYQNALAEGKITEKEKDLLGFVLAAYGDNEFSTKQLERDFADAAYATIRSFVLKFEEMGILNSRRYGNRVKYRIAQVG